MIFKLHYKITRILLTAIGLWPYANPKFKWSQRIFFTILLAFSIYVQLIKILKNLLNMASLLETLSFAVPCILVFIKYTTFCMNFKEVKGMIEVMKCNWNIIKSKKDTEILQKYANIVKVLFIAILVTFYCSIFMFLTSQCLPKILDVAMPLNESRPFNLLGLAAYFFDQDKYFVPIFIHMTVALVMESTTILATEGMNLIFTEHICALFKIASVRMEHAFDCAWDIPISEKINIYHTNIINAVIIQVKAMEFVEYFQSLMLSYFLLLIFGVCSLSINMFRQFCQAMFVMDKKEAFAIGLFLMIHFTYLFLNTMAAQVLTDHSNDIFYKICNLPWYTVPTRLQKLILFIMQRSLKSCKLKLYTMYASVELFTSTLSMSLSYFTLLWSLQHKH